MPKLIKKDFLRFQYARTKIAITQNVKDLDRNFTMHFAQCKSVNHTFIKNVNLNNLLNIFLCGQTLAKKLKESKKKSAIK